MRIKRKFLFSGKWHELDIPVSHSQIIRWRNGELIQNAMPKLSAEQREFMTGITEQEWKDAFGPGESE